MLEIWCHNTMPFGLDLFFLSFFLNVRVSRCHSYIDLLFKQGACFLFASKKKKKSPTSFVDDVSIHITPTRTQAKSHTRIYENIFEILCHSTLYVRFICFSACNNNFESISSGNKGITAEKPNGLPMQTPFIVHKISWFDTIKIAWPTIDIELIRKQ